MKRTSGKTPVGRILRRLWIVVLCMAIAGTTASLLSDGPETYSAEAILIVPGGGSGEPGRASEAQRLAATYAAVLGADDGVTPVVAAAVGRNRADVEERFEVVHVSGTSVVRVNYEAPNPQEALQAVGTFVRVVSGEDPQTSTVSPGTLLPTRVAATAEVDRQLPAVPIGLLLGLALGVALVIALQRAEPRMDEAGDLSLLVSAPVSVVEPTPEALGALARRWARQTDGSDAVAIVPLSARDSGAASAVHAALVQQAEASGVPSGAPVRLPPYDATAARIVLESRPIADEVQSLILSERCTAVVLVVTRGSHVRAVQRALRDLEPLEARVLWCLLVPKQPPRLRATNRESPAVASPSLEHARSVTPVGTAASTRKSTPL